MNNKRNIWFSVFAICSLIILSTLSNNLYSQTVIDITDEIRTDSTIANTIINIYGKSELHLLKDVSPIPESQVNLHSENAWLFFDFIRPNRVLNNLLVQIKVNGEDAVKGTNVRVVQYKNGTVVIPHSPLYKPLTVYDDTSYTGTSMEIGINSYYKASTLLSGMNDTISSFKLKRGYMATFAQNENGTGFSKVYVAQDGDIDIKKLPNELNNKVSFVRVLPWIWTNKKGYAGDANRSPDTLRCGWRYDWNNSTAMEPNVEYVPMRHNSGWNSYSNINKRNDCTHVLAFNEPDKSDQADMTVAEAIAQWPQLLASGLRLGSPAPSDGGLPWLYNFMERADELDYRVDFVAVHFYKGGWTADEYYDWLKDIHEKTGRPIWITEWNNGANWTCCEPTYTSQAQIIGEFIAMLDTASFVERYCFYNWVGDTRKLISNDATSELTQAGIVYRDDNAPLAYFDPRDIPESPTNLVVEPTSSIQMTLTWTDNADNEAGFIVERKTSDTTFTQIARLGTNTKSYVDKSLLSSTEYTYRVMAYNSIGNSEYSNIASDSTQAGISILPQTNWMLHYADSEELTGEDGAATNAFDGNESTIWHTQWDGATPTYPHEIQINLGRSYSVAGLIYLPRQDGNINGTIAGYEIYVSKDGEEWGTAVASGTWGKNSKEKDVEFEAVDGQYVRLLAKSEVNGNAWAAVAEINLMVEGSITSVNTDENGNEIPSSFVLGQNFPNPFNPTTTIKYSLPEAQFVTLKVYDMLGKEVAILVDEDKSAGTYHVNFDARNLASGIYFYSIRTENYFESKKLMLLK